MPPVRHSLYQYTCNFPGCTKECRKPGGLTQHRIHCKFNPKNIRVRSPFPEHPPDNLPAFELDGLILIDPVHDGPPLIPDHGQQALGEAWTRQEGSRLYVRKHPYLDGVPCTEDGYDLLLDTPPSPLQPVDADMPASPFDSAEQFELADLIFNKIQMSAGNINSLMDIWTRINGQRSDSDDDDDGLDAPFDGVNDLYETIDSIPLGDIPWDAFTMQYGGEAVDQNPASWMTQKYEVWFRDPLSVMELQFGNPDLAREIDFAPKQVKDIDGHRQYCDLMSGNWAWNQADVIAMDRQTHGAVFAPVVLGSDKTTVSVATGQNEYYPLYASLGNVQNHVRHAHRNAVTVIGFLAIPKTDKQYEKSASFRKFRRQLFHASLAYILKSLKPWMTTPKVTRCGNGHFYRVIYGIGPYIADYPEQCLLSCTVSGWCPRCTAFFNDLDNRANSSLRSYQHTEALYDAADGNHRTLWDGYGIIADIVPFTSDFPRADIHELIAPDLLHQIIKGTFKDHLVDWVIDYVNITYENAEADRIIGEIDHRIAVAPAFPGLRHFSKGRGFKQWTGDDSKGLMKVFLPAITGLVPDKMVRAVAWFLEFCYLVRRSQIDEKTLSEIDHAVEQFHQAREVFIETGVRDSISLPRQHSLVHYRWLIQQFGAPNGLCSSITESQHIKAVKKPYRRSNHYNALGQMLITNERGEKLSALRSDLQSRGILPGSSIEKTETEAELDDDNLDAWADEGVRSDSDVRFPERAVPGYPKTVDGLGNFIGVPHLRENISRFLYDQLSLGSDTMGMEADLEECPFVSPLLTVLVFHSAFALFYAPSDLSGIGGMHRESIHATPRWRGGDSRHDCVFIASNLEDPGFRGMNVAQVHLFFTFTHGGIKYPCAFVHWFETYGDSPCDVTGLWMVEPHFDRFQRRLTSVVHLDSIVRSAHLIPVYGQKFIPPQLRYTDSLRAFHLYYVSKYADHHSHEIAF